LVIAHEIAHVLGLGHAASGVMRRELRTEDVLALRAGTLTFGPFEATQLRSRFATTPPWLASSSPLPDDETADAGALATARLLSISPEATDAPADERPSPSTTVIHAEKGKKP
jgi:hypothetical protein